MNADDLFDRIRLGHFEEALVVPWHAVDRGLDRTRAHAMLTAAFEDPASAALLRKLAEQHTMVVGLDDAAIVERLADMLASGGLVLVRLPRRESAWRPPYSTRSDVDGRSSSVPLLSELRRPVSEQPSPTSTWIEIRCIGVGGAAYAGAAVRVRLPTAEILEARLDGSSTLRLDAIPAPGTCRLEVLAEAKRSGALPLEQRSEISGREPRVRRGGPAVALATGVRHIVIVEAGHGFSC